MKALRSTANQGPDQLSLDEVPEPEVHSGQALVRVKAVGLNRADLLQTMGLYPAPAGAPQDIPGLELAGEVVQSRSSKVKNGARVMCLTAGGAFAELCAVDARHLMPIPKGLSFEEAAAIPEAFVTAYDAAWLQGALKKGQTLLIHAAGSGVGTAAVQLCKALGVHSVGTARTAAKLERLKPFGLDVAVACGEGPKFVAAVREATAGRGADVVLDLVGGEYLPESLAATAQGGTVMLVGLTAGASAEVPLRTILSKRLHLVGTTLRARSADEKAALTARFVKQVLPLFGRGVLKPVVDSVIDAKDIGRGLNQLARNETFGKVVARW